MNNGSPRGNGRNPTTYNSNKLKKLKKKSPFSVRRVLLAAGLGSLALFGAGAYGAYKPAGRTGNTTPWKPVPSQLWGGANAKAFVNLKASGVPIEYKTRNQYFGPIGGSFRVLNQYRYTIEKPTNAEFRWPKGVPLNTGGRASSVTICSMLFGLKAAGILTLKEAAALCAIVQTRHYSPAQYLGFQLAAANIIAGYAAWKYEKDWNEKNQKKIEEELTTARKNAGLEAARNTAAATREQAKATANAAETALKAAELARRNLERARKANMAATARHQNVMKLSENQLNTQKRAAAAAERAAAAQTALALTGLLAEARQQGIAIEAGQPAIAQLLNHAFNSIASAAMAQPLALQGPRNNRPLLLQRANSVNFPRSARTQSPRANNGNASRQRKSPRGNGPSPTR